MRRCKLQHQRCVGKHKYLHAPVEAEKHHLGPVSGAGRGSGVVLRVEKNGDVKVIGVNTAWRSGWLFGTLSFAVME